MTDGLTKRFFLYLALLIYFCLAEALFVNSQSFTIYTIPAPRSINWESPGKLVYSYLSNFLSKNDNDNKRHLIGHMMVELKDSNHHVIAGVTSAKHSGMTRKVLFNGHGLGILFDIIPGKLEETAINLPDIRQRSKNGDIAFLQFNISQPVFDRLWQYYTEYKDSGYFHFYNGLNNPLERTGAGCSAFAFSFLEVAGLLDMVPPEICRIERHVRVDHFRNDQEYQGSVSIFKILFSNKWAATDDPTAQVYATYEPTWLFDWIRRNQIEMPETGNVQKTWLDKAPGILIDCSDKPAPTGPIWKI